MPYFIGAACIDVMDRSCVEECPVDCIYEGRRKLYIHPEECIECGACLPACPMEAIGIVRTADEKDIDMAADNAAFFTSVLTDSGQALGAPGGADQRGPIGTDTDLVARWPPAG